MSGAYRILCPLAARGSIWVGPTERHSSSFPRESPIRHLPRYTVRHKTLRSYRVSSLLLDRLSIHRRNPSQFSSSFVRLFLMVRRWQQGGGGRVWLGSLRKCAKMQDCYPSKRATNHQTKVLFHLSNPAGIESRSRKSAQGDKWSFCLKAAMIAANRRNREQTSPPESLTGLQGEGGACRHPGRPDTGPIGRAFRLPPQSGHRLESPT